MNVSAYTGQPPAGMVRDLCQQLPGDLKAKAQLLGITTHMLLQCLSPTPPSAGTFRDRDIDVLWAMQQTVTVMAPYLQGVELVRWLTSEHPLLDGRTPHSLITNETRDAYLGLLDWIVEHGPVRVAHPTQTTGDPAC